MVGILFGVCTFTYFLASLFESKISHCCLPQITILIGILGTSASFFLIGPWELVFGSRLIPVVVGLGSLGISGAFMYSKKYLVPATGMIIKQATTEYGLKYDDRLLDSISALTNFFCNLGEASGPLVAGFLSNEIGFSNGCCLIGVISLAFCVVYVLVFWGCSNSKGTRTMPITEYIDSEAYNSENDHIEVVSTSKVTVSK